MDGRGIHGSEFNCVRARAGGCNERLLVLIQFPYTFERRCPDRWGIRIIMCLWSSLHLSEEWYIYTRSSVFLFFARK